MKSLIKRMRAAAARQWGFTLVEIMIVLAILGVLVVVVFPNVGGFISRARGEGWDADQRAIQAAVDAYNSDFRSGAGPSAGGGAGSGSSTYPTLDGSRGATSSACTVDATGVIVFQTDNNKTKVTSADLKWAAGACIDFTKLAGLSGLSITGKNVAVAAAGTGASSTSKVYVREVPTSAGSGNVVSYNSTFASADLATAETSPKATTLVPVTGKGSYTWYVDADGRVKSTPDKTAGIYP